MKNQKQASLLLMDMQYTFVSSLMSSPPASSSPLATKEKDLSHTLASHPPPSSLLDESDECEMTGGSPNTGMPMMTTPVLVPSVRKSPDTKTDGVCVILETGSKGGGSESEDDWNW